MDCVVWGVFGDVFYFLEIVFDVYYLGLNGLCGEFSWVYFDDVMVICIIIIKIGIKKYLY